MARFSCFILILFALIPTFSHGQSCLEKVEKYEDFEKCGDVTTKDLLSELYRVQGLVKGIYEADLALLERLEKADKAWVALGEADFRARFPSEDRGHYGSAIKLCIGGHSDEFVQRRIIYWRRWLDGIPEGDVCAGSVAQPDAIAEKLAEIRKIPATK